MATGRWLMLVFCDSFHDVNAEGLRKDDTPVDSAVFSKTLRYFYLLFAPIDQLSIDDYVFTVSPPTPPRHPPRLELTDVERVCLCAGRRTPAADPEAGAVAVVGGAAAVEGREARDAGGAGRGGECEAAVGPVAAGDCGEWVGRGGIDARDGTRKESIDIEWHSRWKGTGQIRENIAVAWCVRGWRAPPPG